MKKIIFAGVLGFLSLNTFASDLLPITSELSEPMQLVSKPKYERTHIREVNSFDRFTTVVFDVENIDPVKAGTVEATCVVNYDQAERFMFADGATPPETFSAKLKTRAGSQVMWPGKTVAVMTMRTGNATAESVQCKTGEIALIEEDAPIKFLKNLFASN